MEFWNIVWMIALAVGFAGFCYISYRVTTRGYLEIRSFLDQFTKDSS